MTADHFLFVSLLGRGGMGEVWKAWDAVLCRWVAVKIQHDLSHMAEARAAAGLSHPNVAAVYGVGSLNGRPYIAMQLIEGRTLSDIGPLPSRRAAAVILDAARGIGHAHERGVIHRDIKPDNIMISDSGHTYVMDFGLASAPRERSTAEAELDVVGTPDYMSPQQADGYPPSVQDDVYALGATLAELVRPPVPRKLAAIIAKATAKDPIARYQGMGAMASDLSRFLRARRRKLLAGAAAILISLLGGIGLTSYVEERGRARTEEAEHWFRVAQNRMDKDDDAGAIAAFSEALRINPLPRTFLFRGFCYWRQSDFKAALKDAEAALVIDPNNAAAKSNRKMAMDALGK